MNFEERFLSIRNTGNYSVIGESVEYKIIVDHENREVILRWQQSMESADWRHNFMFLPWLLKLPYTDKVVVTTHGYACAYKSTYGIPVAQFMAVAEEYKEYRKVIDGWSFGSAMAKISARHYREITKKPVDAVYTYGDVKCWFNPFLHFTYKKWAKESKEFCDCNDIVTWCVPFFWRTNTCSVGGRFSFRGILDTEHNHQHYEECNYTKYE